MNFKIFIELSERCFCNAEKKNFEFFCSIEPHISYYILMAIDSCIITMNENKDKQILIFKNRNEWFDNMKNIIQLYWKWIDRCNIPFIKKKFIIFVDIIISFYIGQKPSFNILYTKYKKIERKIPCSYAFILNNIQDKILLVRHNYSNLWTLPGGKIEKDESPKKCLLRELKEEINLQNNFEFLIDKPYNCTYNKKNFKLFIIICDEIDQQIKIINPFEIVEFKWFYIKDIISSTHLRTRILSSVLDILYIYSQKLDDYSSSSSPDYLTLSIFNI